MLALAIGSTLNTKRKRWTGLYVRTQSVDHGDRAWWQAAVFGDDHVDVLRGRDVVEHLEMMQVFGIVNQFQNVCGIGRRLFR